MRASGNYIILRQVETVSTSGLITAKEYAVDSVGSLVPTKIGEGDTVLFNGDAVKMTLDDGRVCVHYNEIFAFDRQDDFACYVGGELHHGDTQEIFDDLV